MIDLKKASGYIGGLAVTAALILSPPSHAAEYSFPLTWNAHGWMLKFFPHEEQFFLDGGLVATVDALSADAEKLDWHIYLGAGLYVGMGYQDEGLVIFDPYDAHYSLVTGARFEWSSVISALEFRRDCYHDIDRDDGTGEIWTAIKIDVFSRRWYPRYRRDAWSARKGSGLVLEPDWMLTLMRFPRLSILEYDQHDHDMSVALGGGMKIAFAYSGALAAELRPEVMCYIDHGGEASWKNELLLYATWYGRNGTVCLFTGPRWDSQRIKPSGDRWLLGLDFYH